jgi:hypothetical protein
LSLSAAICRFVAGHESLSSGSSSHSCFLYEVRGEERFALGASVETVELGVIEIRWKGHSGIGEFCACLEQIRKLHAAARLEIVSQPDTRHGGDEEKYTE